MKHIFSGIGLILCITSFAQDYYKNVYEAESAVRQGKPAVAVQYYQKAVHYKTPNREDAYNIACLYSKLKDSAHAVQYLQLALHQKQGNSEWLPMDPDLAYVRTLAIWPTLLRQAQQNDAALKKELQQLQEAENYNWKKTFTAQELQADIKLLRHAMEEAHPGLYWYTSKTTFDSAWNKLLAWAKQPHTVTDFYYHLLQTVNLARCIHTETTLPQPIFKQFIDSALFFPLPLKFYGAKAFINVKEASPYPFSFGDEVVALNGMPITKIHATLQPLIVADGYTTTGKQRVLNRVFYRLYTLVYQPGDSVQVTYKTQSGSVQKTSVKTVSKKEQEAWYKRQYPELNDSLAARFYYAGTTPVLKINTFNSGNYTQLDYFHFLDSVFTTLKQQGATALVLDIRQNNGGDERFLQELLSYLVPQKVLPYKYAAVKTNTFDFLPYTDNFITGIDERIKVEFQPDANGRLVRKSDWAQTAEPKAQVFTGNLYVLISGLDVSAGSSFPSLLYHNRGNTTFLGEETGGGFYGNNSSYYFNLTLPNTKIKFRLPLVQLGLNVTGMPRGHGLMPQVTIVESLNDIQAGRDAALQKAIEIAAKK